MLTKPSLLIPVENLKSAIAFFVEALGAQIKFQDGDRYCALRLQELDIGLASGAERIVEAPSLVLRSLGLEDDLDALAPLGARLVATPETGPHERRAILESAAGIPIILSQKL
jgi:hypothetical protein